METEHSAKSPIQKKNFGSSGQKLCKSRYKFSIAVQFCLTALLCKKTFYPRFYLNAKIQDCHFLCLIRRSNLKSFYLTIS